MRFSDLKVNYVYELRNQGIYNGYLLVIEIDSNRKGWPIKVIHYNNGRVHGNVNNFSASVVKTDLTEVGHMDDWPELII